MGPLVSGSFLFIIGILNLIILVSIVRIFRRMRQGEFDEQELEEQLDSRGFMNRFYGRATKAIKKPWQMYPLGCLFGLGFDTATEIALLVLAGGAAASGLPFYAIICLPILFAAGMSLFDTIDGAFMNFAYGWAFAKPVRKIFYNMAVTGLSVAVALLIGTIELLSVVADRLSLRGGLWDFVSNLDLNLVGYVIVGMFVVTWAIALSVWHFGRIEERWSSRVGPELWFSGSGPMTRSPHRRRRFGSATRMSSRRSCANEGHRLSAARRLVLDALFTADGPVAAEYMAGGGRGWARRSLGRRLGPPEPDRARGARRGAPRPHRAWPRAVRAGRSRRTRIPGL